MLTAAHPLTPMRIAGFIIAIAGVALSAMGQTPTTKAQPEPRTKRTVIKWSSNVGQPNYGGNCIVYTPPGYEKAADRRWPLIMFYHGAGGKGSDIARLDKEFIPAMFDREHKVLPAIVICPQARDYWRDDEAVTAFDFAVQYMPQRVDPDRIYITGLSSGGGAAWQAGKMRAKHIAALAPMCPYKGGTEHAENLAHTPIWTFHNIHDPYCPVKLTRDLVAAVRDAGNEHVRYTELTEKVGRYNQGKDNWPHTHMHAWATAYQDPEFWKWMLAQKRNRETDHDAAD